MSGKTRDVVAHEYDGIQEYDNPTPGWWHLILVATVLFSLVYWVFWHWSPLSWTNEQAWAEKQTEEYKRLFGAYGQLTNDVPTLLKLTKDPAMMQVAKSTFAANCAACHGPDGGAGGLNGVNLCDDAYKNAKSITELYDVIGKGAANGAMPAWESRLQANERVLMAAYVAQLRGTKPANAKPPEGEVIPSWPAEGGK